LGRDERGRERKGREEGRGGQWRAGERGRGWTGEGRDGGGEGAGSAPKLKLGARTIFWRRRCSLSLGRYNVGPAMSTFH